MWAIDSYLLQTLTVLTSDKVTFEWTDVYQKFSDDIKEFACDTLSAYLDLNECVDIQLDAINYQLGTVIGQKGKRIVFYRCKLTGLHIWYKAMDK